MTILLTVFALALFGMAATPDQPQCSYKIVRTVRSDTGIRAQQTIRICDAGSNIVTLDNQIYILNGKRGHHKKILVIQFESSRGEAVPMEFRHKILYIHVYRFAKPKLFIDNVNGAEIKIKRDFIDRTRLKFIDIYGKALK
ncbi:hypothetical protein U1839_21695 [Sphingomonas sp. RT2P30]|uniref:hypothetical protein n=1 Tax=Parasphingomonas halimpatiens TaxID=3096162 RepID=UPI002FCCABE8